MFEKTLVVIPARGGSKGVPKKNIKPFLKKPLIHYSIEFARLFVPDENICVTTDDVNIVACVNEIGLEVPFLRPSHLANDTADTFSVLRHAYEYYLKHCLNKFDSIILLQPTSPFREKFHLEEAMALFSNEIDMVVSVCESKSNPYFTIFEENSKGLLHVCKGDGNYTRRQDAPITYELNGSIYIINTNFIATKLAFNEGSQKVKYVMDDYYAVDIDTIDDWNYAEYKYLKKE